MNKIFYCGFFVLCLFVSSTYCQDEDDDVPNITFLTEAAELCTNITGDPEYYVQFYDALKRTRDCVHTVHNQSTFRDEYQEYYDLGRANDFFNLTCQKRFKLNECLTSELEIIEKCYTEEQNLMITHSINAFKNTLEFACKDDGAIIAEMVDELRQPETECRTELSELNTKCTEKTIRKRKENLHLLNVFQPESYLQENMCDALHEYQKCIYPKILSCDVEVFANVFNGAMNAALNGYECEVQEV